MLSSIQGISVNQAEVRQWCDGSLNSVGLSLIETRLRHELILGEGCPRPVVPRLDNYVGFPLVLIPGFRDSELGLTSADIEKHVPCNII
jgi:hypothetical protein